MIGFNLFFETPVPKDHITIRHKYSVNETNFNSTMNFTNVRIKDNSRFLGLSVDGIHTYLAVGINHPDSGVTIDKIIKVENISTLHCFDADEIMDPRSQGAYAIIDCAHYTNEKTDSIAYNEFLYVDLGKGEVHEGTQRTDVFVDFTHVRSRHLDIIVDPFIHVVYLLRVYTSEGVDHEHRTQTYAEIFMLTSEIHNLQILDVIDHTLLNLKSLAIVDYQYHGNSIYLLVEN